MVLIDVLVSVSESVRLSFKTLFNSTYTSKSTTFINCSVNVDHDIVSPLIFLFNTINLLNVLTYEQKQQIMKSRMNSLEKIVEITHCGEMNQFKNIIVTNLKDNFAYRYDNDKGGGSKNLFLKKDLHLYRLHK